METKIENLTQNQIKTQTQTPLIIYSDWNNLLILSDSRKMRASMTIHWVEIDEVIAKKIFANPSCGVIIKEKNKVNNITKDNK